MKKVFLIIVGLSILSFSNVYSYELTLSDTDLIVNITNKIEDSIAKKGEKYRYAYTNQIKNFQEKHTNNERMQALTNAVSAYIKDDSRLLIQNKILLELDKVGAPDLDFLYSTGSIETMPFLLTKLLQEKKENFQKLIHTPLSDVNFNLVEKYLQNNKSDYLFNLLTHLNSVNGNDQIRNIVEIFQEKFGEVSNEIGFSKELYEIYKMLQRDITLNSDQLRIINRAIDNFKLQGINLSEEKISRLKEINQEISKLEFQFGKNVIDAQKEFVYFVDNLNAIKEMPSDILEQAHSAAKEANKDGYLFDYSTIWPLVEYSSDENIRKTVRNTYKAFASSGKYDNSMIIINILKLRQEKATILGYKNYGEYSLANKMAPSPEFVIAQEDQILKKAETKAQKELSEIKDYFHLTELNVWDYGYYVRKLQEEKYQLDNKVLREYFEYNQVKQGLFTIAKRLYGLEFKISDAKMYSKDVVMYDVYKDGKLKGYYIIDPFYNPNKTSGAWANIIRNKESTGSKTKLPIVTNFYSISKGEDKTLLNTNDIQIMFHEFGHAVHALLSESEYSELNGFNVEWDFAEVPSQLMENWTQGEGLKAFAYNYKNGKQIDDDLVAKIEKANTASSGVGTMLQILYSRVDMLLHTSAVPNTAKELEDFNYKIIDSVGIFKNDTANKFYTSYSHIFGGGYSAGYYSYTWAEIIESDIFSKFSENGIFNAEIATKFYDTILSQGSRKPALELFKDFIGREIKLDGFYKKKGF